MIVHPAQHFLLNGLVDYAGLFPPAALSLPDSLEAYRSYQQGQAPSLLGRLICPASRLSELAALIVPGDAFLLSVLAQQPEEVDLIESFHHQVGRSLRVDTVEARWGGVSLAQSWLERWNYWLFFEVKPESLPEAARWCAPRAERLGLKLRTGAVVPEGIPPLTEVVDFVRVAHQHRVPYKFTAGLHHAQPGQYPLTYEADAPRARLLGFVPLFALACLHYWGRLDSEALLEGLSRDRPRLHLDGERLNYEGATCSAAEIEEFRRQGARSFGSCSFQEPLQELMEMGWIC